MLQTVLVFVLVPLGFFLLISLLAGGRRRQPRPRYRPGEPWRHEPVWWTANPVGAPVIPEQTQHAASAAKGGADGGW
jgi:hypothetical protein